MPSNLGRYAVRRRIGAGGFATVWLAYDEQLDSPVAVKVLADNWTEDAQVRQRFTEEGRYLRRVESPYVVTVHDAGELDDGRPYLVMTYADQGTLADRLELELLTVGQALVVLRQVATGLRALHDRDILHRDVKPANVLFRSDAGAAGGSGADGAVRAMLGDLGLGKALDVSSRLTMIAGTPSFVAPEQAQAEALDARADQYSLAALAYLLLAGRPPYAHTSLAAAAEPAPPPPLSTPERPFPEAVDVVVRRGLARDRADRFDSVTAFVDALEAAVGGSSDVTLVLSDVSLPVDRDRTQPGARPTPRPTRPTAVAGATPRAGRRRALARAGLALLGVVALVGGGAAGYAAQRGSRPAEVEVDDDSGQLSVVVPHDWDGARAVGSWLPPNADGGYPALSVGDTAGWNDEDTTQDGVFVALLPGDEIPPVLPQHPECESTGEPVVSNGGTASVTVTATGCPGGAVTIERVVQVSAGQLLWVQVRSRDRAAANRVLDTVETHGI